MKRTWVGMVSVAAAVLVGAAGCSSDEPSASPTTRPKGSTTTTATATTAPEPAADQRAPTSINGLTVDGDTIWVASIADDEVLQVDRDSGAILARYDTEGAGPDDVAIGPDGSVWTTGFTNGDLGRIADGAYEKVQTIEAGINPLEFGTGGTLYVGTYGPDGTLYELATDGGAPKDGAKAEAVVEGLPDINAFGVLADGTLVAPAGALTGPSEAVRIDPAAGTVSTIVGGLPAVAAGATDADGTPYVLGNITGEVIAVDVDAETSEVVQTVEQGSPFDNLAFADDGTVYLSSFTAPTITEVTADGTERVIPIGR